MHVKSRLIDGRQKYRSTSRELLGLSAPIALTQLAQVALTTTDTVMMGLLGVQALAAGGLAITLFNQLRTMAVGLLTGVGNLISTAVARGERDTGTSMTETTRNEVRGIVRASFTIATGAGILGAVILLGLGYALRYLGQDADIVNKTMPMLAALAPGLVPCLWFQVIRQFTVGMRRPKALLLITIASVLFNVALNYAFIYGPAGIPKLGLAGIGVSTSAVYLLTFLIFTRMVQSDNVLAPAFSIAMHRSDPRTVRDIITLGLPIAGTYGSEAGLFSVATVIIGSFGAPALAAHTVVNQLTYIVFQVSVGISHGSSILISRVIGLGQAMQSRGIAAIAFSHAAVVVAAVAVLYILIPEQLLSLFMDTSDSTATSIATGLLLIAMFQQFADSAQNIGIGLLRGAHDTTSSFAITLIGYWAVGLPVGLLFAYGFGLHAYGMWIGLSSGLLVAAILLLKTFRSRLRTIETS